MSVILPDKLKTEFESKYLNVYNYPFGEGGHYYTASRRIRDNLVMFATDKEYKELIPDAVTIAVILKFKDGTAKLLLNYEFRYALARYILAPPAGLIDSEDALEGAPVISAAIREVYEETGLKISLNDRIFQVNPLLFSSPGMTDESNAIVCAVINDPDISMLNHNGVVGAEEFDGFELVSEEEARAIIASGKDKNGNSYSVYTYICLLYFVSMAWK